VSGDGIGINMGCWILGGGGGLKRGVAICGGVIFKVGSVSSF